MKTGVCKLCEETKPLLTRSHIIPEFMYKSLFDEHHQLRKFNPLHINKPSLRISNPSSGDYEGELFCKNCDGVIMGQYETYASKVLYTKGKLPDDIKPICKNYKDISICENVDYRQLKLFLLSMLFKASISTRQLFEEIKLDEETHNLLKQMILSGDPGDVTLFPIVMFTWWHDPEMSRDLIAQPLTYEDANEKRYVFVINGAVYNIFTSMQSIPKPIHPFILQPNKCSFLKFEKGKGWEFIVKYYGIDKRTEN